MFYVGGAAGLRIMGAYAAGTTYFANDLVQFGGGTYIATTTTTGNGPDNTGFWVPLVTGGNSYASNAKWSTD